MHRRLWVEETIRCRGAFLRRCCVGLEAVETLLRPGACRLHGLQCIRAINSSRCDLARGLRVVQNALSWTQLLSKSHPIRSPPEDRDSGCSGIAKPRALAGDVVNQISLDTWPNLDWKVWDVVLELCRARLHKWSCGQFQLNRGCCPYA